MVDLDQGGQGFHKSRVYLGPSLGWIDSQLIPTRLITAGGAANINPGDSVVLVNVAATVTLNLPDVNLWWQQFAYQPATGYERALWVKDLGGNASSFNITIQPFGSQQIDGVAAPVAIVSNFQLLRLYPLEDLSGWYIESNVGTNIIDGSVTTPKLANGAVTTAKIADGNVTYAKIQNVAASRLLGNPTGSPAAPSEIPLGASLVFAAGNLVRAALTGDVTAPQDSNATSIAANAVVTSKIADANVTNAKLANMNANTVKSNLTGGAAAPVDNTVVALAAAFPGPFTTQFLTAGTGATYTTPASARALLVLFQGGAGGGGAAATNAGGAGGTTTFNSVNANGGGGGPAGGANTIAPSGGSGGTGSALFRIAGNCGTPSSTSFVAGGNGGAGFWGGAGKAGLSSAGQAAPANSGAGGGGGQSTGTGGGGAAGEFVALFISGPAATYTYTIGTSGAGGAAGTQAGGAGGTGWILVLEFY